ncbi:MAG: MarR family winged helix-turn-helix transcriptional regulator [Steroidobacteraceae bacterium]
MGTLRRLGPIPARRLAVEERLQPQSLTRLIGELEAKGWIARTRSEIDRREISIELTGRGRDVLAEDMRARRMWLEKAMGTTLTEVEREALIEASGAMLKLGHL